MSASDSTYQRLHDRLSAVQQEHVLRFWNELDDAQRDRLTAQIDGLDLLLIARLYDKRDAAQDFEALAARAKGPPAFRLQGGDAQGQKHALELGTAALASGKIGAVLVAGGQGTRLGFDHAKGMFPIGPVSGHSLFQILFEKLVATRRRYGAAIPLYIMTSDATHDETVAYLGENNFFGLPAADVRLFKQGNLPAVDAKTGKLLLESRDSLALSPDGHGGMLAALESSGALADMQARGLEQLFYFQIDNPLVVMCDPLFLGFHLASGSEMSTQVVAKTAPEERVGNVVSIDGVVQIIEYSDLPAEHAKRTAPDGSLELWAGSIAVHYLDVAFLARVAGTPEGLPFHVARKTASFVDETGQTVEPGGDEKNAIKFERFIFDLLPAAKKSIVMEVDPAEAFGPVKNADDAAKDTPTTVRRQMVALHRQWLEAAGAKVQANVDVEIRPTFALDAAELAKKLTPPCEVSAPQFFSQ
jgi:UDP-N-acetylglucosamine/UDP-N-acetylgalactosamine diphosphorylase